MMPSKFAYGEPICEVSKAQLLLLDKLNLQSIIDNKNMAHAVTAMDLFRMEGAEMNPIADLILELQYNNINNMNAGTVLECPSNRYDVAAHSKAVGTAQATSPSQLACATSPTA